MEKRILEKTIASQWILPTLLVWCAVGRPSSQAYAHIASDHFVATLPTYSTYIKKQGYLYSKKKGRRKQEARWGRSRTVPHRSGQTQARRLLSRFSWSVGGLERMHIATYVRLEIAGNRRVSLAIALGPLYVHAPTGSTESDSKWWNIEIKCSFV